MAGRTDQKQVSVYVSEDMYTWLTNDAQAMGLSRAAFLRHVLERWMSERESTGQNGASSSLATADHVEVESQKQLFNEVTDSRLRILTLEGDVKTLTAVKEGLTGIVDQQRERIGMADALSIELTKRLEASQNSLDRMTLMLPAPGETDRPTRFNWRFWQRGPERSASVPRT